MTTVEQDLARALAIAEMHRKATYWALAVILALIILFFFMFCRAQPNVIPPTEQKTIDSMKITKPIYDSSRKENVKAEGATVLRSSTHARQATTSLRAADSLHALALIAQQKAEAARDTSSLWRAVAMLKQKENDSLRSANRSLDSALTAQKAATAYADQRAKLDSARLVASNQLNDRLANDVKTAGQCGWGPFSAIRCPTRTETAVVATVIGVVAGKKWYDSRRKP